MNQLVWMRLRQLLCTIHILNLNTYRKPNYHLFELLCRKEHVTKPVHASLYVSGNDLHIAFLPLPCLSIYLLDEMVMQKERIPFCLIFLLLFTLFFSFSYGGMPFEVTTTMASSRNCSLAVENIESIVEFFSQELRHLLSPCSL